MIYGTPAFRLDHDSTDLIGIRTLAMSKLWQPSRWPLTDAELAGEKPEPPEMGGGMILKNSTTQPRGGGLRTAWTYEGVNGDGKSVTFKTRANTLDYGFQPGFAQVDLKLHPRFQELLDTYGGQLDGGDLYWPPTYVPGGTTGGGVGRGGAGAKEKTNPMFGRQEFLRVEGTYTCRYAAFTLAGLARGVEQIHKSGLPGKAPSYKDRDWLKAPSPYERRGPVYEITEIYWLSGPGGWPGPIYGYADSTSDGSGLSTGGVDGASNPNA